MITKDYLHELFEYKDGELFRKITTNNRAKQGARAGSAFRQGYEFIGINNKVYLKHRLIFMMFHGYLPKKIDHIDGNPKNSKIENLREANDAENSYNAKLRKDNTSGCKGVIWHKWAKKWKVTVKAKNTVIYSKYFDDLELADLVAQEARNKYHGNFSRHK